MFNQYGDEILDSYNKGKDSDVPEAVDRPLSSAQNRLVKEMREVAQRIAKELGLSVELLGRKETWRSVFVSLRELAVYQVFTRDGD